MKKLFRLTVTVLMLVFIILFTACRMEPTGVKLVKRQGGGLVHPGILHTQEDFLGMLKLMDRWQGITRNYETYQIISENPSAAVTPAAPTGSEQDPTAFVESFGSNLFKGDPDKNPVPPDAIADYRELRASRRRMYAEYRAKATYDSFIGNSEGNYGAWTEKRYEYIGRDGEVSSTKGPVETDIRSAYFCAVRWMITGDKRYAQKAFTILDSYARYLKGFKHAGYYDHMLMVGLQGQLYAATAEIIRYGRNVVDG